MHGTISSLLRVEWRPLTELADIAPQWRALAERALEPNAFYEPAFALAAAPVFGRGVAVALVWTCTEPARLVGLFPARVEARRYGLKLRVLVGWTHAYGPLGTPLVDRDAREAVIAAWLDHVAEDPKRPDRLLLPFLPEDGPVARALETALRRRGGCSTDFARHERAMLAPDERTGYLDRALGSKKRKELRRQLRRLGDHGVVTTTITRDTASIPRALEDFLALESRGWKGRAHTAAGNDPAVRTFLERAVGALADEGKAEIARLFLDARTIAALIMLRSGDAAWCWKIAYDESLARASPGVQVLLGMTEALLAPGGVARADSCATADHPMIDHIWRERLALVDRLVMVSPVRPASFALLRALETTRRTAIAAAKRARDLIRRRP